MEPTQVIEWLNSDEGLRWSRAYFEDATECHDLIEITDDYDHNEDDDPMMGGWWSDSTTHAVDAQFKWLKRSNPEWRRLRWTPDHPPEGGRPCGPRRSRASSRCGASSGSSS